jgi:hypothetical protein
MNTRTLLIVLALLAPAGACKGPRGEPDPAGGAAPLPALWEPVDKDFKGCEGG